MATLTVTQAPSGSPGFALTVTMTYSISDGSDAYVVSVSKVACTWSQSSPSWASTKYTIKLGNAALASNVTISAGTSSNVSYSATVTKTHSAQTKALTLSLGKGEIHYYLPVSGGYDVYNYEAPAASNSTNLSIGARPSYAVTYDANGGNGAPSSQTKWYGEALTLQSGKPTYANYVFRRWNTNTSDTGTAYNPSAKYEGNAALALYAIWNPIIAYDANGGTGAPSAQTKTFGVTLTLQAGVPTRTGYAFVSWNTTKDGSGSDYAPSGSYASNVAATLYAKWRKLPDAPTISSLMAVRSNSAGNADDGGTYCKVTAKWSIDTTNVSGNTATVTGTIKPDGGSATAFTFSSGASGTNGTAVALIGGLDTDKQYSVAVTVTDTLTATSRVAIMTRASFILDLKAGGTAMGIGSAAPDSGLEVGWPAQFDQAVGMLMGLAVGGDLTVLGSVVTDQLKVFSVTSDVATASSGWVISSQAAHTYGKVVSVSIELKPTSATAQGSRTICTLGNGYRPKAAQGFADASGMGLVSSGGGCTYRNIVDLTTTSTVHVALTFIKG